MPLPLRTLLVYSPLDTNHRLHSPSYNFRHHRALHSIRSHHPHYRPKISGRPSLLRRPTRNHGCPLDGPLLHSRLCNRRPRMVTRLSRLHPHPHQSRICTWRCANWLVAHQARRVFLAVRFPSPSRLYHVKIPTNSYILIQTINNILRSLRHHSPPPLPNLHAYHPSPIIPALRPRKRLLHRRSTKLHTRSPPPSHTPFHTFHLHFSPHHIPRLRGKFWLCDWWGFVCARTENGTGERVSGKRGFRRERGIG
jgi:hypothetical protein